MQLLQYSNDSSMQIDQHNNHDLHHHQNEKIQGNTKAQELQAWASDVLQQSKSANDPIIVDQSYIPLEERFPFLKEDSKRTRKLLTPEQTRILEAILDRTQYPSTALREAVAKYLQVSPRKVQIWFQNKRQGKRRHPSIHSIDLTNSSIDTIRDGQSDNSYDSTASSPRNGNCITVRNASDDLQLAMLRDETGRPFAELHLPVSVFESLANAAGSLNLPMQSPQNTISTNSIGLYNKIDNRFDESHFAASRYSSRSCNAIIEENSWSFPLQNSNLYLRRKSVGGMHAPYPKPTVHRHTYSQNDVNLNDQQSATMNRPTFARRSTISNSMPTMNSIPELQTITRRRKSLLWIRERGINSNDQLLMKHQSSSISSATRDSFKVIGPRLPPLRLKSSGGLSQKDSIGEFTLPSIKNLDISRKD